MSDDSINETLNELVISSLGVFCREDVESAKRKEFVVVFTMLLKQFTTLNYCLLIGTDSQLAKCCHEMLINV